MKKYLALIVLAVAGHAQAQYRCTGADASVSFQQAPCAAAERSERLALPPPAQASARSEAVQWAIANRRVMVGMNRDELRRVMLASPNRVNTTVAGGAATEQHVYYRPTTTVYVYLDDGVVTAVQVFDR